MECKCKNTIPIIDEMVNSETGKSTGVTFKEMCIECLEIRDITEEEFKKKEIDKLFIREIK